MMPEEMPTPEKSQKGLEKEKKKLENNEVTRNFKRILNFIIQMLQFLLDIEEIHQELLILEDGATNALKTFNI